MATKKKPDPVKINIKQPEITAKPASDLFDKLGNKAPLVAIGMILLIGVIVFKDFLFFEKAYFFKDIGSDSYNFSYPYLYQEADYISKFGIPKWSFNFGMGQSLFPFFLRDPFDIFLYIAGKNHIYFGIVFKELLKILLGGITFFYYLKALKLSDFTSITGSLLFAFCGFVIVGSGWYIFSFEAFNMALLLLAYEQLFTKQKWHLFPVAIFLVCISQPFNLYVYGIFLAFYAVLRHVQTNTFNAKNTGLIFLKMIGLGALGMLLSAPFMIENIFQLLESPRGSGTNSYAHILSSLPMFETADKLQMGTSVMRFFSSDLLGNGNEFKGWQNYLEAPLFYCGIPCLLLMPQVFQFLDKRAKIAFGIFIGVWLLPIIFPYFRMAFWLFTGDYYRGYSVLVAFVVMFYALQALDQIIQKQKINLIVLIVTVVALFALLYYPYFPDSSAINSPVLTFVSFMLLVYGALLYFISRQSSPVYLRYIFFAAVVFELFYLSGISVNERNAETAADLAQKKAYNDYSVDAVNFIKSIDNSFYRIDKTYASSPAMHYSLNDGMAQGYNGSSGYSPFNQEYYVKYLQLMGISNKANELESRWANGLSFRPVLESENRVKYILAKTNINPLWQVVCDQLGTFGDVKVFRNKFVLPVGYTYNYYLKESVFDQLSTMQKDFVSLATCIIKDEDAGKVNGLKEFQLKDTITAGAFNTDVYRNYVNELSKDTLSLSRFDNKIISGMITVSDNKMMYLSVPYDGGWQLKVDGQPRDKMILDGGMTGIMLTKGPHTIEMAYDLRFFSKGLLLCALGIILYIALWFFTKKKEDKESINN